jgi:hypothetical protein
VFLKQHGFKKFPINASAPAFFVDEIRSFQSSHLVIGIETRKDKGIVISRWSASVVEIMDCLESHLEMCICSYNNLHGKRSLMLLLKLGQYLECTRSNIILPSLKCLSHGDKIEQILSLIGFYKTPDVAKIGGIMLYDYPKQLIKC